MLLRIDENNNEVQALVLAPARKSAKQFHKEIQSSSHVNPNKSLMCSLAPQDGRWLNSGSNGPQRRLGGRINDC